jgi:hypothetical protein
MATAALSICLTETEKETKLKNSYRNFLVDNFEWQVKADLTKRYPCTNFDNEISSVRYILNRISRDMFGRRYYKHGRFITAAVAIENLNSQMHSHLLIGGIPSEKLPFFNSEKYQYIFNSKNNNIPRKFIHGEFLPPAEWHFFDIPKFNIHQKIGARIELLMNKLAAVNYITKYFSQEYLSQDKVSFFFYPDYIDKREQNREQPQRA